MGIPTQFNLIFIILIYTKGVNGVSRAEILQKIRDKEEQLENQIAEAEAKKEQMIQDARQEAVKLLNEGEVAVEKKLAQRIAHAQKTLGNEKVRIINEKLKDTEKIKAYAEQNFDKAIPLILDIFERSINAETPKDE